MITCSSTEKLTASHKTNEQGQETITDKLTAQKYITQTDTHVIA